MEIPQIPPLKGMTPLGYRIINGESTRKPSNELFEAPFNLAGELLDESVTHPDKHRIGQIRACPPASRLLLTVGRTAHAPIPALPELWRRSGARNTLRASPCTDSLKQ